MTKEVLVDDRLVTMQVSSQTTPVRLDSESKRRLTMASYGTLPAKNDFSR